MYKFRYSILSTITLSILALICLVILVLGYIGCSKDGYNNVEIISLAILTLLFLGLIFGILFFVNKFTAVLITLNNEGIEKKNLFGKKIFVNWNEIIKIENGKAPDYISGSTEGYIFTFNKIGKEGKIIVMKNKKVIEAMEKVVPKNLMR